MRRIDPNTWARKPISDFFGHMAFPFYSVTFRIDATGAFDAAKAGGYSVYAGFIHAATAAVNSVDAFLYKLRGADVVRYDFLSPSFTVPAEDGLFRIVGVPWRPGESRTGFAARYQSAVEHAKTLMPEAGAEPDDLIFISCMPGIDFTSVTSETDLDRDDSAPRLTWGKLTQGENGRRSMPFSVQVNHRLIDGSHLEKLQGALAETFSRGE